MSIPTFAGTDLLSAAARETIDPPETRAYTETMPGIDGLYVQPHGIRGRRIRVTGVLQESNTSAATAHEDLKISLRMKQTLADGLTVADYVGTDGASYENCVVLAVQPAGPCHTQDNGDGTCTAVHTVEITLLQLTP